MKPTITTDEMLGKLLLDPHTKLLYDVYMAVVNAIAMPHVEFFLMDSRAKQPFKARSSDAGYDLTMIEDVTIQPNSFVDTKTGVCVKMPEGVFFARITGRSSTSRTWGLHVNEGIVDSTYTHELRVGVWNWTDKEIFVPAGTRLAQLIFQLNVTPSFEQVLSQPFYDNGRNDAGFGSTGK